MTSSAKYIEEILTSNILNQEGVYEKEHVQILENIEILHDSENGAVVAVPEYDIYLYRNTDGEWKSAKVCEVNDKSMKEILINNGYKSIFSFHTTFNDNTSTAYHFGLFIK